MKEQDAAHSFTEGMELTTPFFKLSRNEYGKAFLMYSPEKGEPGRYSCWEPIDEKFYQEFEQLQQSQTELTRLRSELKQKDELIKELLPIAESFFDSYPLERVKLVIEKSRAK